MAAGAVRRFGLLFCAAAVCLLWQWQLLAAPAATLTVPLECEFDAAILSNGHMFTKQADVLRSHPWKTNGSVAVFWHIGPGLHAAQVVWEQFHLLQQTLWRLRRVVQSKPKVYAALQEASSSFLSLTSFENVPHMLAPAWRSSISFSVARRGRLGLPHKLLAGTALFGDAQLLCGTWAGLGAAWRGPIRGKQSV